MLMTSLRHSLSPITAAENFHEHIQSQNVTQYFSFETTMKSTIVRKATKAYANYMLSYGQDANPEFPGFMLCSYQGHSRRKVIEKYPQMNSTHLYGLYGSNPEFKVSKCNNVWISCFVFRIFPSFQN